MFLDCNVLLLLTCCKINRSDLVSCCGSEQRLLVCSTQALHSQMTMRSGPGSVLFQLSAVYLKGLLRLVLRCFGSKIYSISLTKMAYFHKPRACQGEKEAFLDSKQRRHRNVTGSWCRQTEPQLIYDSMHLVIHGPVKKRQTRQTADGQTDKQTEGSF